MTRDVSGTLQTLFSAADVRPCIFVECQFDGGTVRLFTGTGTVTWNSQTWTGAGDLLDISPVNETSEVEATGMTLRLSGLPGSLITTALGEHVEGRKCIIYLTAYDASNVILSSTVAQFAGRMESATITDDGETGSVEIAVENRLIDLNRARVARYTNNDQQLRFPGDLGFQFVAKLEDRQLKWGPQS